MSKPSSTPALAVGQVFSETQFYTVQKVTSKEVVLLTEDQQQITVPQAYVDKVLHSADRYTKEEKKTKTELADIFCASPRMAMTVCFTKAPEKKKVKDFQAEVDAIKSRAASATRKQLNSLIDELIANPVTDTLPGTERVMKGHHFGVLDSSKRIQFVDQEIKRTPGGSDNRMRLVDPRTISYLIVGGVKYSLK